MTGPDGGELTGIPLSRSQQNIYSGVLQDGDPALYLVARRYQLRRLQVAVLRSALHATILKNPVQLCVLRQTSRDGAYPDLVPMLCVDDIVSVVHDAQSRVDDGAGQLQRGWVHSIYGVPLVRYVIRTDRDGYACGLDAFTHHILLDGGATGIIEADLGDYLSAGCPAEMPSVAAGVAQVAAAHRRETSRVQDAHRRLTETLRGELSADARLCYGQNSAETSATATRAVRRDSVRLGGAGYASLVDLSESTGIPLNVLVATAAVAVDASTRHSTASLLIHATDNRFGEPDLDVATCLVNSVPQPTWFPPFASVHDVARILDRGYVRAMRRKWLREEHYRRIYLAVNRTSHVTALTLNFLREPCAASLRRHLREAPVTTAIGPVETTTVACVLDDEEQILDVTVWTRDDFPQSGVGVAGRIAAVLEAMPTTWHQPLAATVGEWFGIEDDGTRSRPESARPGRSPSPSPMASQAWFLDGTGAVRSDLRQGLHVDEWIAWLVRTAVKPGDVVVFTDDDTDKTVALLVACHLAGCGYSVCDTPDDLPARANAIAAQGEGVSAHIVDIAGWVATGALAADAQEVVARRVDHVAADPQLGARTAYFMPTSGSTGQPKLVRVSHESLSVFSHAIVQAYGWTAEDTVLQCAPLTSDISVEEIFAATLCGARIVRSAAMKAADLQGLSDDVRARRVTVVDLPTAVWHLLCDDEQAMATIRCSQLRQVVVGGEAIRSGAVDRWIALTVGKNISLISSYGPTEATVASTYLPIVSGGRALDVHARSRLGRPVVPGSVYCAFGEVVIVGESVASGYLGVESAGFGVVTSADGTRRRAFATADRVVVDEDGFPVLKGRRDAVVKVAGRRVDTAEVTRRVAAALDVTDVAVEINDDSLGVWFATSRTRAGTDDAAAAARIRTIVGGMGVPSFTVAGVPGIPRRTNGKIDSATLRSLSPISGAAQDPAVDERATGLAMMWSRRLGRDITADSSLLDEGVGSLDLIRILPHTRRYLARHMTILDLISADTATNLVADMCRPFSWLDATTAAEIEQDLAAVPEKRSRTARQHDRPAPGRGQRPILVLGGSGILGTGFAEAAMDVIESAPVPDEWVFVTRSPVPEREPWLSLRRHPSVRLEVCPGRLGPQDLERLLDDTDAATVVNCIGNTNVLVPYRELRPANVELVSVAAQVCAGRNARLVQLSTFVVTGDVTAPQVIDPREAPYPYAASKAMAELIVAHSSELDFTIARLPRVLGQPEQMAGGADILTAVADACLALCAHPAVTVTEEVTTGRAAARAILDALSECGAVTKPGRALTVVHGQPVAYRDFLAQSGGDELDAVDWKRRLDASVWARRNPRRWSAIDAWFTLGMHLGSRTYAEYLGELSSIDLGLGPTAELRTEPVALPELMTAEYVYRMATRLPTSEEWN
ncbi:AMP-binding protein [Mycolicibacterium sp. CBM1]